MRDGVLAGDRAVPADRDLISDSWHRSLAARVDPGHGDPLHVDSRDEVGGIRSGHPLDAVLPLLRDTLVSIADEAVHMMIVTDAQGNILWPERRRDVLRRAERVGPVDGTRWTEDIIGANAMDSAPAADRAVPTHSTEHLVRTQHSWTCAAAPIHDPDSGAVIGAVDVTGPARTFHPTTLALVVAAARMAESHLATRLAMHNARDHRTFPVNRHSASSAGRDRACTPSASAQRCWWCATCSSARSASPAWPPDSPG